MPVVQRPGTSARNTVAGVGGDESHRIGGGSCEVGGGKGGHGLQGVATRVATPSSGYGQAPAFTAILRGWISGRRGASSVSTPSLRSAWIFAVSVPSGRVKEREKDP